MTAERKEKCRKALIGWLCVAALVSGVNPVVSPLTTTAIAAEASSDENSYDGVIDLSKLKIGSTDNLKVESETQAGDACYVITLLKSGTYKLTGSNLINNSYVDISVVADYNVEAQIVCDNVYIKNDNRETIPSVSGSDNNDPNYYGVTIFSPMYNGKITLSGTIQVDVYNNDSQYIKNKYVSGDFFEVSYKNSSDDLLGKTFFLSGEGNTYKDKSELSSPYPCLLSSGASFDLSNITKTAEVICYDTHVNDGTGKCTRCGEKMDYIAEIDLSKIVEYCTNNPFGSNVEVENYYNECYIVRVKKSGSYKIIGSNCVNNAYVDIKFEANKYEGVTADLYFDDVYIKNNYGYAYLSGSLQHFYTSLFNSFFNGGISGKLRVDTRFFDEDNYVAPIGGPAEIENKFFTVNYKTPDGDHIDTTYFLKGETYSDDIEAVKDFRCIGVNGKPFDISHISGDSDVTVICSKDHTEGDGTCENCGKKIYTVAFGDSEEKVYDGELLVNTPADPAEEIGKKFIGWFDENGEEFDPTVTITGNVRYTAKFADRDVKKISLAEKPVDSYIEGNTFDPAGLKLTVTYDDDREKEVEYSADDINFEFLPALDQELTTADTKVSVSYRGSTAVDIPITVAEKQVSGIKVKSLPAKTSYIVGESVDVTGGKLTVSYNNGTSEDIDITAAMLTCDNTKAGESVVTVTYGKFTDTFSVVFADKSVSGIKIKSLPAKTSYIIGESVDVTGGKLTVSYNNGTSEDIDITAAMLTCDNTKAGESVVTVTYGKFTDTFSVVFADKSVSGIKIKSLPAKTSYIVGESVDVTGGKLTVSYNNGTSEDIDITAAMLTCDNTKVGESVVTVTYGEFTDTFSVTFAEVEKETTAAPVISPNGGTFTGSQKITITCPTAGAVIYYTTDGTTPNAASTKYTGEFTITTATTVKAIAVSDGMNDSTVTTAAFTKKTSGSSRPTRPTTPDSKPDTNPTIDGKSKSWSDIGADIKKLPAGSTSVINMNGETNIPADVIKAISESKAKVELVADSSKSWIIDGSKISTVSAADFSILPGNADKSGLRGVTGADIKINNIGIPADLKLTFRKEFAGQFANLYKVVDGKLVFQSCSRVGDDGTSVVSGADSKGEYVVMVCEFSGILGDMSNDGVLDARDSSAILKSIVGAESGANPLMADFNGDGTVNALDASAILKLIAVI